MNEIDPEPNMSFNDEFGVDNTLETPVNIENFDSLNRDFKNTQRFMSVEDDTDESSDEEYTPGSATNFVGEFDSVDDDE